MSLCGCMYALMDGRRLTQRIHVVMVLPSQSLRLKVKKQHTQMKKRSDEEENKSGLTESQPTPPQSESCNQSYPIVLGTPF